MAIENIGLYPITIDVYKKHKETTVHANDNDSNGRGLLITLVKDGVPFNSTGINLKIGFRNAVGEERLYDCDIVDVLTGKYKVFYPTEMLVGNGGRVVKLEIKAYEATGALLNYSPVFVYVNPAEISNDAIGGTNETSTLVNALSQVQNIDNRFNLVNAQLAEMATNVKNHGVKGDGVTDDHDAIQMVLNVHRNIYFPAGDYRLDLGIGIAERALMVPSNTKITFHPDAKLKLNAHSLTHYEIINIADVENVHIVNPVIDGNRAENSATAGEWGMGIALRGAKNVIIENPKISNCWGDGIYIGIGDVLNYSENVVIQNPVLDNNRRQGISVISVKSLKVINPVITNTNGTAPDSGIDIEPNNNTEFLQDIVIENLNTKNNWTSGLKFYLIAYSGSLNPVSITVRNLYSDSDGRGIYVNGGENIKGFIHIEKPTIINSRHNSVAMLHYQKSNPLFKITDINIVDCNQAGATGSLNASGIRITKDVRDPYVGDIGNIVIDGIKITDTRALKKTERSIFIQNYLDNNAVSTIELDTFRGLDATITKLQVFGQNLKIRDPHDVLTVEMNNVSQTALPNDLKLKYTTKGNTSTKSLTISNTLPIGTMLEIVNETGTNLQIITDGQTILTLGVNIQSAVKGASLVIKKITATEWLILKIVGTWTTY